MPSSTSDADTAASDGPVVCEDVDGDKAATVNPECPEKPYLVPVAIDEHITLHPFSISDSFTLPFEEPLAAKRVYSHAWTVLPSELANIPCHGMEPQTLLKRLNMIFDTSFILSPGAEVCLSEFINDGCDLGTVYGYLRPWWRSVELDGGFDALRSTIRCRMEDDHKLRTEAVAGSHITKSNIPPRRVWDLYANRVLPYHAIMPKIKHSIPCLPDNLWAVSHSWRPAWERQSVLTTINGKSWRVPIPKGTTLNAIRDELLIMGAEYVFLDVLCLRQKDELLPGMEGIRKREWRLDIPTIGHVYNEDKRNRPIVVYFNGLGLPFQDAPLDPNDKFHWFNRIWTLQETPQMIIFGGLQHKQGMMSLSDTCEPQIDGVSRAVFDQLRKSSSVGPVDLTTIINAISSRTSSNPVDEVACLAYLLRCPKLPIYDADMDVEVAWSLLVECMSNLQRTILLCYDFNIPGVAHGASWRPTWKQVKACGNFSLDLVLLFSFQPRDIQLQYLDGSSPSSGYRHGFDAYYHTPLVIEGCYIHIPSSQSDISGQSACVRVPSLDGIGNKTFEVTAWGRPELIQPNVPYLLIGTDKSVYWIVAQAVGSRRIDGFRGLEVSKLSTIKMLCTFDPAGNPFLFTILSPTWAFLFVDFYFLWEKVKKEVKFAQRLVVWR